MEKMCVMRFLRIKYGVKLRELAEAAEVSVQYISCLELGECARTEESERLVQNAFESVIKKRTDNAALLSEAFSLERDGLFLSAKEEI